MKLKVETKAMLIILVITIMALSTTTASALGPEGSYARTDRKLERLYRHHDRKFELRASVLGMDADQLREELRRKTFNQILSQRGFSNLEVFHKALEGKVRDELKKRGLSENYIQRFLQKRLERFDKITS